MKRKIIGFVVLVLIILCSSSIIGYLAKDSKNAEDSENKIKKAAIEKIEKEMQACLDKGIAMHGCCYDAMAKYDIEIQKTLDDFKKVLSKSQYETVIASQEKWEEFTRYNNEMLNKTVGGGQGTMLITITAGSEVYNTKYRLEELNKYYSLYKNFKSDGMYDD